MLILASLLHVVAVAGLDPVGAIDLLSYSTLVCHGINDTLVIGGESWLSLRVNIVSKRTKIKETSND